MANAPTTTLKVGIHAKESGGKATPQHLRADSSSESGRIGNKKYERATMSLEQKSLHREERLEE